MVADIPPPVKPPKAALTGLNTRRRIRGSAANHPRSILHLSVSRSKSFEPNSHRYFSVKAVPKMLQFLQVMVSDVWSPIIWEGGLRRRDHFKSCKYAALDFDTGEWTLAIAEAWCREQRLSAIIGTSKSHQKEKRSASGVVKPPVDRFRLVLPFGEAVTDKQTYEFNMRKLCSRLPCDSSCVDAARFFYPCTAVTFSQLVEGSGLAVLPPPAPVDEDGANKRAILEMEFAKKTGVLPAWVGAVLKYGCEEGGRHKVCYRLGANLIHAGYSELEIVALVMTGPLGAIGIDDVEKAVRNGATRSREKRRD